MPANPETDPHIQLMLRVQQDDEAAFTELVGLYQRRVVGVAYRFLQRLPEAEEAAQETFLRVYQARKKYRPSLKFSSWIFTITHRVCLNLLRHRRRHPAVSLDAAADGEGRGRPLQVADPKAGNAEAEMAGAESRLQVQQAVAELPEVERMALILEQWEDLSLREIGGVLHKSTSAVKSILFRARAKLRVRLAPYLERSGEA